MAKQPKSLNGRVVAITGGARGIGKATAAALVRQGARVAIGDIDAELARRTAGELGENVRAYELDVTSRPSFKTFLDAVETDLGPLERDRRGQAAEAGAHDCHVGLAPLHRADCRGVTWRAAPGVA